MIYYQRPDEEDQPSNQAQNQSGFQLSGAAPVSDSMGQPSGQNRSQIGTGATPSMNQNARKGTGSGFVNLDRYLQGNNAQGFANQVNKKVQGEFDEAKQGFQNASQAFQNQVAGNGSYASKDQIDATLANPSQGASSAYQQWMKQSYSGPKSLSENAGLYNQYYNQANDAKKKANLLGTNSGRFTLLNSYFGKPGQYSSGQNALDSFLYSQGTKGNSPAQFRTQANQLMAQGQAQEAQLADQASQTAKQVQDARQYAIDSRAKQIKDLEDMINAQVNTENAARNSERADLQNRMRMGLYDSPEMEALAQQYGDKNAFNQLFSFNPGQVTKEQVATPEQRARLEALAQLGGETQNFLGAQSQLPGLYEFNNDQYNQVMAQRAVDQQNQLNELNKKIDWVNQERSRLSNTRTNPDTLPELNQDVLNNLIRQRDSILRQRAGSANTSARSGRQERG